MRQERKVIATVELVGLDGLSSATPEAVREVGQAIRELVKALTLHTKALEAINRAAGTAPATRKMETPPRESADDLLTPADVCRIMGGNGKPVHVSTLNRWIRQGKFPRPRKLSPRMNRWRRSDCEAAIGRLLR